MIVGDGATLVRRAIEEIWNRGELDLADQLFAPGYVNHGGLVPDLVRGPEAIKVSVAVLRTAFPDLRIDIADLIGAHDTVAVRWVARGAGTGTSPPDALTGMTFVHVAGGRVTESWMSWETGDTLKHLFDRTPGRILWP